MDEQQAIARLRRGEIDAVFRAISDVADGLAAFVVTVGANGSLTVPVRVVRPTGQDDRRDCRPIGRASDRGGDESPV